MEDAGLNTFQLRHALSHDDKTQTFFDGVFPSDFLKNIKNKPKLIIVNTDPSTQPGKHWLLFFLDNDKMEMFDSLGRSIEYYSEGIRNFVSRFAKTIKFVDRRIQPLNSSLCGHYCLYFAYCRCNGQSMDTIVNNMHSPEWIKYCVPILFDIPGIISECQVCETI